MIFSDKKELLKLYNAVAGKNIYGRTRIPLPTPRFIVFYNGTEERPDREVMRLSDSYTIQGEEVMQRRWRLEMQ